jgi:hypothetical protein
MTVFIALFAYVSYVVVFFFHDRDLLGNLPGALFWWRFHESTFRPTIFFVKKLLFLIFLSYRNEP